MVELAERMLKLCNDLPKARNALDKTERGRRLTVWLRHRQGRHG